MASTIILFLSVFNSRSEEKNYTCPDDSTVPGTQTNDAPVRYLLRAHPDIQKILCVVTTNARETAWEHFQHIVKEAASAVEMLPIPYEENENFSEKAIPMILEHVQRDDEIFLDVTGGFRNANMYLLLLSRVLSYKGIRTVGAVYSNFQAKRVEDVFHLIEMFDLVGGMQELTSFGNVQTLRAYYDQQARKSQRQDGKIVALLNSMERLNETITLCRTSQMEERMKEFNSALTDAEECEDPLMRTLLPVFREKFERKLTTPGLIKWCVENGMIQQALTIYKERIPTYLIRDRTDILEVKAHAPLPNNLSRYENEDEARFYEHLLKIGGNMRSSLRRANASAYYADEGRDPTVITLKYMDDDMLSSSYFKVNCTTHKLSEILMDYLYIRALRNMIHHANDSSTTSQKDIEECLVDAGYKRLEDVRLDDVKKVLLKSLDHLKLLTGKGRRK